MLAVLETMFLQWGVWKHVKAKGFVAVYKRHTWMWREKLDVVQRVDTARTETDSRWIYKLCNVMEIVGSIFAFPVRAGVFLTDAHKMLSFSSQSGSSLPMCQSCYLTVLQTWRAGKIHVVQEDHQPAPPSHTSHLLFIHSFIHPLLISLYISSHTDAYLWSPLSRNDLTQDREEANNKRTFGNQTTSICLCFCMQASNVCFHWSVSAARRRRSLCGHCLWSWRQIPELNGQQGRQRQGWEYAEPRVYFSSIHSCLAVAERHRFGSQQCGGPHNSQRAPVRGQSSLQGCCLGRYELSEVSPEGTKWTGAGSE